MQPPVATSPPPHGRRSVGWIIALVGGLLGGLALAFGIFALGLLAGRAGVTSSAPVAQGAPAPALTPGPSGRAASHTADGIEIVTYDPQATASMATESGTVSATDEGTVVYSVSRFNGEMSFKRHSASGSISVANQDGTSKTAELKPGTGSTQDTCTQESLTQKASGSSSAYRRVG